MNIYDHYQEVEKVASLSFDTFAGLYKKELEEDSFELANQIAKNEAEASVFFSENTIAAAKWTVACFDYLSYVEEELVQKENKAQKDIPF